MTTRVFPHLARDRMALKLNGKYDRLRRADFRALAVTAGLRASDADAAIDELVSVLARALDGPGPVPLVEPGSSAADAAAAMRALVKERLESLT